MYRVDPAVIKQQVRNLMLQYPELAEDQILREDMIEGETDAYEFLSRCVRWIGEDETLCESTSNYIKDLQARRARIERRVDAFRALAFQVMQAADLKKAELPEATLSVRAGTPKVIIIDETELPDSAVEIKRVPDKTTIKGMLTAGEAVPGAMLSNAEPTLSIRTR